MIDLMMNSIFIDGDTMDILGSTVDGKYSISVGVWSTASWQHYCIAIVDPSNKQELFRSDKRLTQVGLSVRDSHNALHAYLLDSCEELFLADFNVTGQYEYDDQVWMIRSPDQPLLELPSDLTM